MTNNRKLERVQPKIEDILSTAQQRLAYEEASAALEAGRLVRALREQAGLTQIELARRLDVKQPRVSAIEAGLGRDGPSYALLRRIVVACGATWTMPAVFSGLISEAAAKGRAMRDAS
jgi:transcriptional regulator with XRE-family HTH domain